MAKPFFKEMQKTLMRSMITIRKATLSQTQVKSLLRTKHRPSNPIFSQKVELHTKENNVNEIRECPGCKELQSQNLELKEALEQATKFDTADQVKDHGINNDEGTG